MVRNLDDNIGEVMQYLQNAGLTENTVVVFLSDNGGAEYTLTTENGPYKGGKITDLEGGIKVPMIIQWKNVLPPGVWYEKPVMSLDVFATIAAISSAHVPAWQPCDGVNLMPYLHGKNPSHPHRYMYWQRGFSVAIRSDAWKMLINGEARDTVLFNLLSDPYEETDLHHTNRHVVSTLAQAHRLWASTLPPPLWPSMIYYHYDDNNHKYYFDQ